MYLPSGVRRSIIDTQCWETTETLTHKMLVSLEDTGLITSAARDDQLRILYHGWQLPMYHIDFGRIDVPLKVFHAQRDANY